MNSLPFIGFSQRIKLDWMEETAKLMASGRTESEIKKTLRVLLKHQLSVGNDPERGNREKAITILLKTWVRVAKSREAFRDEGLVLIGEPPEKDHDAIHWAAAMAAYPFFGDVAETTGRLIRLQDDVSAFQVQRRLKERFGERETVARAARRVLRTFMDWGVLQESGVKGTYRPAPPQIIANNSLLAWMTEAALYAAGGRMQPVKAIRGSPKFFPFNVTEIDTTMLTSSPRLEVFRQGIDEDFVMIR